MTNKGLHGSRKDTILIFLMTETQNKPKFLVSSRYEPKAFRYQLSKGA